MNYAHGALIDDIGAPPLLYHSQPSAQSSPVVYSQQFDRRPMDDYYVNGIIDMDVGVADATAPPSWLQTIANTGLEFFRVREGRKAMRDRHLTPDEASLFTRPYNKASLSPFGSTGALVGIGAVVVALFLLKK